MSFRSPATPLGSQGATAGAALKAAPCLLANVIFNPGSATSSFVLYDNASAASGTILCSGVAAANASSIPYNLSVPIVANNGVYAVVIGTAATINVSVIVEA